VKINEIVAAIAGASNHLIMSRTSARRTWRLHQHYKARRLVKQDHKSPIAFVERPSAGTTLPQKHLDQST